MAGVHINKSIQNGPVNMVVITVLAEEEHEPRVALSPETAKKFTGLGAQVRLESKAGLKSGFTDGDYEEAGVMISSDLDKLLKGANIVMKVGRPTPAQLEKIESGTNIIGILNPFDDKKGIEKMAKAGVTLFAMEFMPRITRAQSMDVLSSQSNLAGYKAVIDAAQTFDRAIPMMMTAAGTVPPARVFVMGVGVAGLQAIATAKRLGAIVTATDVRPATKEQVESLGGKFIAVENEEFKEAETGGGYAKQMSDDYQRQQAELVAKHISSQDLVITTALIPGRPAPELISEDMVKSMHSGAVIVDLAAERGGNCALTQTGKVVIEHGVKIMGKTNLAGELAVNASALYARNLYAFVDSMYADEMDDEGKPTGKKLFAINWEDEIITGTLVARDGKIVHPRLTDEKAAS